LTIIDKCTYFYGKFKIHLSNPFQQHMKTIPAFPNLLFSFLLLLGFALLPTAATAQFGKRLGESVQRAAERVVERKLTQKVEKKVSEKMDSVLVDDKKKQPTNNNGTKPSSSSTSSSTSTNDASSSATPQIPSENKAVASWTMDMTTTDKNNKVNKMNYKISFDKTASAMKGTMEENGKSKNTFWMIGDLQDKELIFISGEGKDGKPKGTKIKMGSENFMFRIVERVAKKSMENKSQECGTENTTVKKTGATKKIQGYNCSEYIAENSCSKSTFWITTEIDLTVDLRENYLFGFNINAMGAVNASKEWTKAGYPEKGASLEMDFLNKKDNTRVQSTLRDFRKDEIYLDVFNTAGMEIQDATK
jgi:demethoxyubiquinone hydroxylase (CLK1/Coq7/Cat5 family)